MMSVFPLHTVHFQWRDRKETENSRTKSKIS